MSSFSQLVDTLMLETNRFDMASSIISYLNQTIRELHQDPDKGNSLLFWANRKEDRLVVDSDQFSWKVPVGVFQQLEAVRYNFASGFRSGLYNSLTSVNEDGGIYARELHPGPRMNSESYFFYRAGDRIFFSGYGGIGSQIDMSYFLYPKGLTYFKADCRPAWFDEAYGIWRYLDGWVCQDAESFEDSQECAKSLVTNWIIERWPQLVLAGARAKIYTRLADTERARTHYSLYTQQRYNMATAEIGIIA